MSNNINSSTITCNSTHLTSFAVLVDVSDGHQVFFNWGNFDIFYSSQFDSQNLTH